MSIATPLPSSVRARHRRATTLHRKDLAGSINLTLLIPLPREPGTDS